MCVSVCLCACGHLSMERWVWMGRYLETLVFLSWAFCRAEKEEEEEDGEEEEGE